MVHREQCGDHRDTHLGRPPHEGEAKDAGGEDIGEAFKNVLAEFVR